MSRSEADLKLVRDYHERTKHRLDRYAAGPDFLDWEQQPDPFRRFHSAPLVSLPLDVEPMPDPSLGDLAHQSPVAPIGEWGLNELSSLLRHSLGLAAWKVFGPDRWSLRCNPSSGNLHPTEGYLIVRGLTALADGVYHYAPHEHALECRGEFPTLQGACGEILIGLSSIAWREAWKYGERAYRYVHLDLGHAIGALVYAAGVLGFRLERVTSDEIQLAALLGLDRQMDFTGAEAERPDLLLRLVALQEERPEEDIADWLKLLDGTIWHGRANTLSPHPVHRWPIIDAVADATPIQAKGFETADSAADYPPPLASPEQSVRRLTLQRRSAQAFNGKSSLSRECFFSLLDSLLPRQDYLPWRSWPYGPLIHLVLFVHRVDDLPPGLYLLARSPQIKSELQQVMREEFEWECPAHCPTHLPLFRLVRADTKRAARTLSCHQDIAASSFFSLGMVAEFERALTSRGAGAYPELYWEAGLIGQVLYLQAEAAGVRGTGIGCFFDDAVHETLGLSDHRFQSLYHFTVGQPKPDTRLQTLPPYHHLVSPTPVAPE
jgi:SagB-type dehydrogenase family enzyme